MPGDDNAWQRILDGFSDTRLTPPMRFDAVNGSRLTPDELNACLTPRAAYELSAGRRYPFGWVHEGIPSLGAVGCYLSHVELWKRAADRTVPTLILEQDAEPSVSLDRILDAIANIPTGVDVALLGHLTLFKPRVIERFSSKLPRGYHPVQSTSDVFCTHAYVVTPEGARKLADQALPINAQVDAYVRFLCTPESGFRMVYHSPSLIHQCDNIASSIQPHSNIDYLLQGSTMAARALVNGVRGLANRSWQFLRNRLRFKPTRHIIKEQGVLPYLVHHPGIARRLIRSALLSYDPTVTQSLVGTDQDNPQPSGKTIWTYWDQGIEALPAFNRLCISTWVFHNPDWSILVLDPSTVFNYLEHDDLPPEWDTIKTAQAKADLIRLALLTRFGGVWMDSSIILQQSLDELVWNRIEQQSLDLAGFSIRRFSREGKDDIFESWFIACKPDSHLIKRWHQVSIRLWENRQTTSGILADPLFQNVDLQNIDGPEYLHLHCVFQALIQNEPECRKAFFERSWVIPADNTAFRWQDRHGFTRVSGLALLGREYEVGHFSSTPLLKFTGWPAAELFARFNTHDLLDQRHTLGRLLRRNLPNDQEDTL